MVSSSDESEEDEVKRRLRGRRKRRRSTNGSTVFSTNTPPDELQTTPSKDSDIGTMASFRTNMDQLEEWVLNKDRFYS